MLHRSARRLVVAPLLLVSLQLPGVAPAQADPRSDIRSAQSRINRLQALVETTSKQIAAGTREYEKDQAALAKVRARLIAVNAQLDAQEKVAADGQARVAALARFGRGCVERGAEALGVDDAGAREVAAIDDMFGGCASR